MSLFTRKMKMLTAVVIDKYKDNVAKALLEEGVMEFVHIDSIDEKKLSSCSSLYPKQVLTDLRVRIEGILSQAGVVLPELRSEDVDETETLNVDDIKQRLDNVSNQIQRYRDSQKVINQRLMSARELEKHLDSADGYADLRIGIIDSDKTESFASRLSEFEGVSIFDRTPYVTLTLTRDASRITELSSKFNWVENPDPKLLKEAKKRADEELEKKISSYTNELKKLEDQSRETVLHEKDQLVDCWKLVRLSELSEHIESYFSQTKHTVLFSGWIPSDKAEGIERIINDASSGKCIIQWSDEEELEDKDVPVELESAKFFKPFEHLVKNYGTPEYKSINPTPFATVAYILMFMLMFADLGQGFVLLLIGLIGSEMYKKHPEKKDGLISRYLCSLLIYLGPASMVGGLLFGSCFGYSIFPPLWFNYHAVVNGLQTTGPVQDIYDILGITIWFGIAVIYTGLILNWINLFRKKRYIELICSRNGIVGGVLFIFGIWFAYCFVKSGYKTFPSSPVTIPLIVVSIVVILMQVPLEYFLHDRKKSIKKKASTLIMDSVMELLVEALEIFSGFLSNTLSFMRVAGLGIAHVCLMTAFEDMAGMTDVFIFKLLIMIAGNFLVIALEGLSAGIQALRLNYYEFFTKYFTGRGNAFAPIGVKSALSAK